MGTEVQCKSYSSAFHSMWDLNEDANSGNWPVHYDDKVLKKEQYYNCYTARSNMDGYQDYEKEILKQTILEHENVFRKQVYELHRLYRTQRDLMNEFKRNEFQKYARPMEVSQSSNQFSSQTASQDVKNTWQVPSFPISGVESMQSPACFIRESSLHVTPNVVQDGSVVEEDEKSKSKQVPRKMFDLQLPAYEYIDSDGETGEEKVSQSSKVAAYPLKRNRGVASVTDMKLSLGGGVNLRCQGDASRSDTHVSNRIGLADLNQPIQIEETVYPTPVDFLGTAAALHGRTQGEESLAKANYPGFPRDYFSNAQNDKSSESHQNGLCLENEGRREKPYNLESGLSRGNFDSFKLPAQSASPYVDLNRTHEYPAFSISDSCKRQPWGEAVCGLEIPESSQSHYRYNYLESAVEPRIPTSYTCVSQSENNSESSSVSSWIKPINNVYEKSIEVRALPCLNSSSPYGNSSKSSVQIPVVNGSGWHFNNNPRPMSGCGKESYSKNGFYHGSQADYSASKVPFPSTRFDFLNGSNNNSASEHSENRSPTKYFKGSDCLDVKSAKGMNLNLAARNGFQNGAVRQHDLVIIDGEGANEDRPLGLPWLRAKLAGENGHSNRTAMNSSQVTTKIVETGSGSMPSLFLNCNSSQASNTPSVRVGDCPDSRRILGFPIFDKSHISKDRNFVMPPSKYQFAPKGKDIQNNGKVIFNVDLSQEHEKLESSSRLSSHNLTGIDLNCSGFGNDFNLNLCTDEEENAYAPHIPKSAANISDEMDLEVPVVSKTLEGCTLEGGCSLNRLETKVQPSATKTDPLKELERIASEAIVLISSSTNHLENSALKSSEESLKDSLGWFADVVSAMADLEIRSRDREESSSESDYFETMTLKLTETKLEELPCRIWVPENHKEAETVICPMLTRRRRGQSRRGRQKKDFQRDILPGLVSLSRHEVTEDLQTFGGMMKAMGHSWQSPLTRRNAGRNGWARGRKRTQGAATPPMVTCSLPKEQPSKVEVTGFEEKCLKGWGKTTRRPRRQRLPAGTPLPV
ncbi:hypothetical protein MKW94_007222 [Papaver nudicaule]|uniref:Uncharacterized protein n=1 Tax=Papaver nudicaule TaxID=74823 RepID=A0AA41RUW5_PAPNU|nr:hypothetical protein [Papaver nudicaule]